MHARTKARSAGLSRLVEARRVVVKVGSALLVDQKTGRLNRAWLEALAQDLRRMRKRGQQIILVSSGAIALGRRQLGLQAGSLPLEQKQAAAAVGQIRLAHAYKELLEDDCTAVAQVLLTLEDSEQRRRYLNARATLNALLSLGAIPVINENDTVATAEIRYGDNDRLAARVAQMASADCLVLLSDVDGLYSADPNLDPAAEYFPEVRGITPRIEAMAGGSASDVGSGGMATKIAAARIALDAGCYMCIASGHPQNPLRKIEAGARCTWFIPAATPVAARKQWIAGALKPAGVLRIDAGAVGALQRGRSLLPAGVVSVSGSFERGDAVDVVDADGLVIARGLSAYSSADVQRIMGRRSSEIEQLVGFRGRDEIVHRDDLVLRAGIGESAGSRQMSSVQAVEGGAGDLAAIMNGLGRAAAASRAALAQSSGAVRNAALLAAAQAIRANCATILAANARDMEAARARGLSAAMLDRLQLNEKRVESMAAGVEQIAALDDPIGGVSAEWSRPNGLKIQRVRVPLGVIGIIYESRPNVTADAGALCLKSANPVILRGGSESRLSSAAIQDCLVAGLRSAGLPEGAIQLVPTIDRAAVGMMLVGLDQQINVIVPRGGRSLVERVQKEARVPVIGHLEGLCHVYVDHDADAEMARSVVVNAKLRRTGICGAAETLLVDKACAPSMLPMLLNALAEGGCELRGDAATQAVDKRVKAATEQDWRTEYLDAIISVRVVDGVDEAIRHIATYGSAHTDSIVTANAATAEKFLREVDSAIVLHNASTQFADGGEFGMGAEIGISTDRFHARGPVGVEQLTSYKYVVRGSGQIRPG